MKGTEYCRTMARYNQWMNEKILGLCAELSDEQRKKDMGAFFKSIHGTLNHILLGDRAWMGWFLKQPFKVNYLGQELYPDFNDFKKERIKTDQDIINWVDGLTDEHLSADFIYTSGVDNVTRTLPMWACVTHLFNHQTHHRGQITTLLKQLGVDPGITDLPWLPGLAKVL